MNNKKIHSLSALLLNSFLLSAQAQKEHCSALEKEVQSAVALVRSRYDEYKPTAFDALLKIYNECQDSADKESLALATYHLGRFYQQGIATKQDHVIACNYFQEILEKYAHINTDDVVARAELFMGDNLLKGRCGDHDWVKAVEYWQKVVDKAETTNPTTVAWAQLRLADAYRDGDGIGQDDVKSVELWQAVINKSELIQEKTAVAWAKYWLAFAYKNGRGLERNIPQAYAYAIDVIRNYSEIDPFATKAAVLLIEEIKTESNGIFG